MRLSDITQPIEKTAFFGTGFKYVIPKIKGLLSKEMAGVGRIARGATAGGKASWKYGVPAVKKTIGAAQKGWSAAATPYRAFSKMTLKGYEKSRNVARFKNPAFTGKGAAGSRLGVSGEYIGGTFIPQMKKRTVSAGRKVQHNIGRFGQFATGPVPLFAGLGAIDELQKTRYPITSGYNM